MDRYQVRYALLKITLLALAGTTWVFWSFIFSMRPEDSQADALSSLVRLPASIPGQISGMAPPAKVADPIEMDVVKLPCWDRAEEPARDISARWVRLTGKVCQNAGEAESISVRNLTNGFSATVFTTLDKGMTTDFIPLQVGPNAIQIRFDQGQGVAKESQFSLVRE